MRDGGKVKVKEERNSMLDLKLNELAWTRTRAFMAVKTIKHELTVYCLIEFLNDDKKKLLRTAFSQEMILSYLAEEINRCNLDQCLQDELHEEE
jgi:hypothetical protein